MKKGKYLLNIIIGNFVLAFAVNMFVIPFDFVAIGSTGLALIINHYFQLPFTFLVTSINVIMFIAGLIVIGKRFALGIVIQSGASTGGMDIPPLILEKKFKIPVGISMAIMDGTIMLTQTIYAPTSGIMCGIVYLGVVTFIMNRILVMGRSQFQVLVMSEKTDEMRDVFIRDLNRGVTMFKVETGYYHNDQKTLMSIVSQKDLAIVQETVNRIDDNAFMVISKVQEVHGKGFKPWKEMKNDAQ